MRDKVFPILSAAAFFLVGCGTPTIDTDLTQGARPVQEVIVAVEMAENISTFTEPWPETFSRKQLGYSLLEVTEQYFENNYTEECSWSASRVSESPVDIGKDLDLILEEYTNTFCDKLQLDPLMLTGSYPFAKEILANTDRQTDEFGGVCGGMASPNGNAGCALFHNVWVRDMGQDMMMGIAAHELFHIVQDSVNPGRPVWNTPPGSDGFIPMWFIEGSAVTYQAAVIDHLDLGDYFMYDRGSSMLLRYPKTNIDMTLIEQGWSGEVYVVGQFATEYLIANVGFEPMLDIITSVGEGATFEESFEMHVGMSLDSFYDKMSRIQILED